MDIQEIIDKLKAYFNEDVYLEFPEKVLDIAEELEQAISKDTEILDCKYYIDRGYCSNEKLIKKFENKNI